MKPSKQLPSYEDFKEQVNLLRAMIGSDNIKVNTTINLLTAQYGYKNWHTLKPILKNPQKDISPLEDKEDYFYTIVDEVYESWLKTNPTEHSKYFRALREEKPILSHKQLRLIDEAMAKEDPSLIEGITITYGNETISPDELIRRVKEDRRKRSTTEVPIDIIRNIDKKTLERYQRGEITMEEVIAELKAKQTH